MDRCPQNDFSSLSLPLCRYCFMEQAFQFEKSLSVKTQAVYDAIALYQLVGRNFLGCPFLLYLFKFQSVHVKGVVSIFSFKFSVLYNLIPRTEGKVLTYS